MSKPPLSNPSEWAGNPIGVFDSGLGGLRVLDRLMHTLPDERFVYLGDTLHMPYGQKSQAEVTQYVDHCLRWLFTKHQVKMVVVACNTAASVAAQEFERYPDIPFVDPVTPICHWLTTDARYHHVGVMATPATVASNRYSRLLETLQTPKHLSPIRLSQVACGNLATLVEEGQGETEACAKLLREFTQPLIEAQVEAVVLGCTHYPYVMEQIAALMPQADILDPAVFMALEAKRLISEHGLAHPHKAGRTVAEVDYFVTAAPDEFYETSRRMPFQALAMKKPTVVNIQPVLTPQPTSGLGI
jgi:glutamate racemase